jgi:mono/diheme cytochrome c family protein
MLKVSLKNVQTKVGPEAARVARRSACVLQFSFGLFGLAAFAVSVLASENSGRPDVQKTHQEVRNPYSGQRKAAKAGRKLFVEKCARCHGHKAEGTANVPALAGETTQSVPEAVIFSYITRGDPGNGMPSWVGLPEGQRWQIVTYLKTLSSPPNAHR